MAKEKVNTINTDEISKKDWEEYFWKDLNENCILCVNTCKQSSKVKLVSCKNFTKRDIDES